MNEKSGIKIGSVIKGLCPNCHQGRVIQGVFAIRARCPVCNYNLHPEPGFYLGAMAIGFFLTAIVTIPPMIILKILNVDIAILIAFPFIEFLFVGSFLMYYCRILWLHLEYQLTNRLENSDRDRKS